MSENKKRTGVGVGVALVQSLSDDRNSLSVSDDRKISSNSTAFTVVFGLLNSSSKGEVIENKKTSVSDDRKISSNSTTYNAFEKHNVEKDVAEHIKKDFNKKYDPAWHCIVRKNFRERKGFPCWHEVLV
ncbi:hypothetical protein P3S68_024921 [Capsicum galapagoense]